MEQISADHKQFNLVLHWQKEILQKWTESANSFEMWIKELSSVLHLEEIRYNLIKKANAYTKSCVALKIHERHQLFEFDVNLVCCGNTCPQIFALSFVNYQVMPDIKN